MSTSQTREPEQANSAAPSRTRVLVLFGGRSGEHPISCITAAGVLRSIDRDRFDVVVVGITLAGRWVLASDNPDEVAGGGELPHVVDNGTEVILPFASGDNELRVIRDGRVEPVGRIDVVLPLLHGPFGEDGTLQGMLELADLRYVGVGVLGSAVGMDKHYMKLVFEGHGIPVGPYTTVFPGDWQSKPDAIRAQVTELGLPVFVKPTRAGSSLGISKVSDIADLDQAMAEALKHDPKVIIEAGLEGREIECAVLGSHGSAPTRASLPGEITMTGQEHEFYDFEAKYLDDASAQLSCPADLPDDVIAAVREVAVDAFEAVGGEGLSRVDVFVQPNGEIVVNEINTMPGFTPISMYPRMWERSGMPYTQLITELIELALERPLGLR
nr:D-alanine--D-alanine ligase family protein [Jonesia quinghaiensis]